MNAVSMPKLVLKRVADDWVSLLSIFVGIIISITLMAAAPVYLKALERLSLNVEIDGLIRPFSNIYVLAFNVPLTGDDIRETSGLLEDSIDQHISPIYDSHERFLIVDNYLAGLPANPLPESGASGRRASRAFFRSFSNMEDHVTVLKGGMAGSDVLTGLTGQMVEAVVSPVTAELFSLSVDDVIVVAPNIGTETRVSVRIVGIVEATDPTEDYWKPHASFFLDPPPPEETNDGTVASEAVLELERSPLESAILTDPEEATPGIEVEFDRTQPPVPLFIAEEALVDVVGRAYPGTLIDSLWFVQVDTEPLKEWSIPETRTRLKNFEDQIGRTIPGTDVFTGITRLLADFEGRVFFSRVPLLLLLAITTVTVLFFLAMMVSYLVQSRERDAALLRTRGVGTLQVMRLYALEGVVLTVVAVALAPFLAMGMVAMAGKLWYFRDLTGGGMLPVEMSLVPFVVSAGAGLLCLSIFVIPGVVGARGGLLAHKLRSSRPPTSSLFHRYYVDVALLAVGGLVYWELRSRGSFISGGLFKGLEVDETLLVAPVLVMVVVALVFMRFFPLLVRFVSGESAALVDLLVVGTVLVLGAGIGVREVQEGNGGGWLGAEALLVSVYGVYWATNRVRGLTLRVGGLVIQGVLVGWFLFLEPPASGEVLFVPTIALISVVPAQVVYLLLAAFTKRMPVWLLMGLWHMARNPLQYTWLVLLLVLVTGAAILSTTVGGTLERSQQDQVQYEVAADLRISNFASYWVGDNRAVKDTYLTLPGVTSLSLALREAATVGTTYVQLLALESREFPYVSWYRDDFSARPLDGVMGALQSFAHVERLEIPDGATSIGIWARPEKVYPSLSMWITVRDEGGTMRNLDLGDLGPPEWQLMTAQIPPRLKPPLWLVSVQIYEGGLAVKTPGALLLDDIHVSVGPSDEKYVLDDFEGQLRWTPIITSVLSPDRILLARSAPGQGKAGVFSFGQESQRGYRGFYQSPTGGPIPVVVSTSFIAATGVEVGDNILGQVRGRKIPMVVRDTVDYFPTMRPDGGGFILVDLDSLLGHLNIIGSLVSIRPNEIFLSEAETAHQTAKEAVSTSVRLTGEVHHMATELDSIRLDPLSTAGWRTMVLPTLSIVTLATGLGYLIYLLSFAGRRKGEMGFLQSLGLSRRQLMGLLGFEQLTIAGIGLGLGTWAGFQMSRLTVSPLAVTERGEQVVPPFILMTDWSFMLPTYGALVVIILASLFVLKHGMDGLDLHVISRAEGL